MVPAACVGRNILETFMTSLRIRAVALAAAALLSASLASSPAQASAYTAAHPAVERALAHLAGQSDLVSGQDSFVFKDLVLDDSGLEHVRFDRSYKGLRVIGGDLVVHGAASGELHGFSRTLAAPLSLSTQPAISAEQARSRALSQFAHRQGQVTGHELVVLARGDKPRLAWDVTVEGVRADGTPSQTHLLVSARNKQLLDQWDDIQTAKHISTGNTLYSGSVSINDTVNAAKTLYTLSDATRGKGYVVTMKNGTTKETKVIGTDAVWGDGTETSTETVAADAAFGYQTTWDYYKNVHGRNGIANDGLGARSRVHYSKNYDNAYWNDSCFCMTYGDGNRFNPLVSLDVAGHEMSHGVTSRTAGLIYSGESGGLNEATSDIFGSMVEYYANNVSDPGDYLIGEKLSATPLRNMINPSVDGGSADCWYSTVGNLDVHYSSGVANHLFYLMAEGTTNGSPSKTCVAGNTRVASGNGTVAGVGRAKAEKIWYRALTVYMTSSTNFKAARQATLSAAADLYGSTSAEVTAVGNAWTAVNVAP